MYVVWMYRGKDKIRLSEKKNGNIIVTAIRDDGNKKTWISKDKDALIDEFQKIGFSIKAIDV